MPYVRRRGSHLAIVHGSRHPETRKVEQQVLMTLHSRAEARAARGEGTGAGGLSFRGLMEDRYPEIRFPWPKIEAAIAEREDELPDIAPTRDERSTGGFDQALREFGRHVLAADPQLLDSARAALERNRTVLEWLTSIVQRRLDIAARAQASDWSRDPFGWRLALGGGTMDPELEEGVARLRDEGRPDEAEEIFRFLVDVYPRYAEGWNYLGLIALDRDDLEVALERFERCEEVGRRLFPKRIPKREYWLRLETRPYIRALRNQCLTQQRLERHAEVLRIADRLEKECGDDVTAAVFRTTAYLAMGEWAAAHRAAVYTAGLFPQESLCAAFAAHELGQRTETAARFVHAVANRPRTVAIVLGERTTEPRSFLEIEDHNGGVSLRRNLAPFLARMRPASLHHFQKLWKSLPVAELRAEVLDTERRKDELSRRTQETEYRRLFDRLNELGTWEHAERVASELT